MLHPGAGEVRRADRIAVGEILRAVATMLEARTTSISNLPSSLKAPALSGILSVYGARALSPREVVDENTAIVALYFAAHVLQEPEA